MPAPALAQETDSARVVRPDTLVQPAPADTFAIVDSIPEPAADTTAVARIPPPAPMIELPAPSPASFAHAVWEWDRDELLRSTALTLGALLERVPSLTRVRAGFYPLPELIVGPAAIGADVEVLIDGFRLDPLVGATPDLSRVGLVDLDHVRVERRGGRLRIELSTLDWTDERPYSVVEAATGDMDVQALRGVFAVPDFLFGPITLSAHRLESEGTRGAEPGTTGGFSVKWGVQRERWNVVGEFRRFGADRDADIVYPGGAARFDGETMRRDMVVRARARPWNYLSGEVYVGRSDLDQMFADTLERGVTQAGARAALTLPWIDARSALRVRDDATVAPALAAESDAVLRPLDLLELGVRGWWEVWDGAGAGGVGVTATAGPFMGARPFVRWSDGSHGVPALDPHTGDAQTVQRTTLRAGVDWTLRGWSLGAAALRLEGDGVARAGVPGLWDPGPRRSNLYPGFDVDGVEAVARIPLPLSGLALEGSYTHLRPAGGFGAGEGAMTLFQPAEQARGGLAYHGTPLEGDQLEIDARAEFHFRGSMLAPSDPVGTPVLIEPIQSYNLDLTVRVAQVRAFVRWSNIMAELDQQDVPGRLLPGQNAYFGVKWELWN